MSSRECMLRWTVVQSGHLWNARCEVTLNGFLVIGGVLLYTRGLSVVGVAKLN